MSHFRSNRGGNWSLSVLQRWDEKTRSEERRGNNGEEKDQILHTRNDHILTQDKVFSPKNRHFRIVAHDEILLQKTKDITLHKIRDTITHDKYAKRSTKVPSSAVEKRAIHTSNLVPTIITIL